MKTKQLFILFSFLISYSCIEKKSPVKENNYVVLISKNSPNKRYNYFKNQKTISDSLTTTGPKISTSMSFNYIYSTGEVKHWSPKIKTPDTLVIQVNQDILEINNNYLPLSKKPMSWLIQKGDTLEFEFRKGLFWAHLTNRSISDSILNYDNYRILNLNKEQFEPDSRFTWNQTKLTKTLKQQQYYQEETNWMLEIGLDSLNTLYRINSQSKLDLSHFQIEEIQLSHNPIDWYNQDSLFNFQHFRTILSEYSNYNLPLIKINYNNEAGSIGVNQKIRFDSISQDTNFSVKVKNIYLTDAFVKLIKSSTTDEIEAYYKSYLNQHSDSNYVKSIKREYNLNFNSRNTINLISKTKDSLNLDNALNSSKGKFKVLYFWATWCRPCKELEPGWEEIIEDAQYSHITFIKLALNDSYKNWLKSEQLNNSYFISNSNVSEKLQEFQINTIPTFILLNEENKIVYSHLQRPGSGLEEQLTKFTTIANMAYN